MACVRYERDGWCARGAPVAIIPAKVVVIVDAKYGARADGSVTTLWRECWCSIRMHGAHEFQEVAVATAANYSVGLAAGILNVP